MSVWQECHPVVGSLFIPGRPFNLVVNDFLSMSMVYLTQELFLEGHQASVQVDFGEVRKASRAMDILDSAARRG